MFPSLTALSIIPTSHGALLDFSPDRGNPFHRVEQVPEDVSPPVELDFRYFTALASLNLHGQPICGQVVRSVLSTLPALRSLVLSHNPVLENIERRARAGYTFVDDVTGNVSPHLEEIDIHRCSKLSDVSLTMLLEPILTPKLKRICIDGCDSLVHPDVQHINRLEGVWINYSEYGSSTSNLDSDVKQAIGALRQKVHSNYNDLLMGNRTQFGILLQ